MGHSLIRLKGTLVNTPHLIEQNSFNSIMEYVNKRIEGGAEIIPKAFDDDICAPELKKEDFYLYNEETRTGILQVDGPITYRTTGWEALCGGTSCQMLKEQMEYFVERGAKTIGMFVDSGGGEARGLFDTAEYLRKLADENGIKIIAYSEGTAASAAYALPAIADEFVSAWDARIGSVGVLISLINDSKALEKEGYERVFVVSNEGKIPYSKDGSFREDWIDDLQKEVFTLYDVFTDHVSTHRPMTKQQVVDTDARVFMADEALSLGLIDKIMKVEDFYDYLALVAQSNLEESDMSNPLKDMFKLNPKKEEQTSMSVDMPKLEEMQAQLSSFQTQVTTLQASLEEVQTLKASLESVLGEKEAALTEALSQVAKLEEDKVEQKMQARKDKLSKVMAAEKVEAFATSVAALDDEAFSVVLDGFATQVSATKKSEFFNELGDQGVEKQPEATVKSSTTDELLRARFQTK